MVVSTASGVNASDAYDHTRFAIVTLGASEFCNLRIVAPYSSLSQSIKYRFREIINVRFTHARSSYLRDLTWFEVEADVNADCTFKLPATGHGSKCFRRNHVLPRVHGMVSRQIQSRESTTT
jgi:hypothetical protein